MRKKTEESSRPGVRPRANVHRMGFRTGARVPQDGIYRVTHARHPLPPEVTLLAGSDFPKCSRCSDLVEFELLRAIQKDALDSDFRICLYELPVMREKRIASEEKSEDRAA